MVLKNRFISPVICNSKIRAKILVKMQRIIKEGLFCVVVEIEIMELEKPALFAETLSLLLLITVFQIY